MRNPMLLSDSYKQFHYDMYPKNLVRLYSNMTPRKSRMKGVEHVVVFGPQYWIKEYLIYNWNENFFQKPWYVLEQEYRRFHKNFSQMPDVDTDHWKRLHDLGYLPIEVRALPEGTKCPIGIPFMTIHNTHPEFEWFFGWLVNFLETSASTSIWDLVTVATIAHQYRKVFDQFARLTSDDLWFVDWQGHDFSMRGRSSIESTYSQAGHLLSFTGSDTIPAVLMLEEYYNANMDTELVAGSVPASEHSVMMCLGKEGEIDTFIRLLDTFPKGILSVVSDTWNLWDVLSDYLPKLKSKILARDGKLVIRPDSGDPVHILCGYRIRESTNLKEEQALPTEEAEVIFDRSNGKYFRVVPIDTGWTTTFEATEITKVEALGVIESLWELFGGTVNSKGYRVLDPHIGAIYGDSITIERATEICQRLMDKGFASTNWVAGIGSYTYNYNTRDTFGMAIKATNCTLRREDGSLEERAIFKNPITDGGEKKSAKGYLKVERVNGKLQLFQELPSFEDTQAGELKPVFRDGELLRDWTLSEIRQTLQNEYATI